MGLGKTFTGAEKMIQLKKTVNLVICQKSKVEDWLDHFNRYYATHDLDYCYKDLIFDLTDKKQMERFLYEVNEAQKQYWIEDELTGQSYLQENLYPFMIVGVINYELAFRRKELLQLTDFTLMLDESSLIQNEKAKRSKFILKMKPTNIILLSGTPTSGKYETLWSQLHLLGWNISKDLYWKQYVDVEYLENQGFPIKVVRGYKNVERLKKKMREYGCRFLKTNEVFDLPQQVFNTIRIDTNKNYRKFKRDRVVKVQGEVLVGDTILTKMLYERMLCGSYNEEKLKALEDLIISTEDRLIIFYNFNDELVKIKNIAMLLEKPISIVNGQEKHLECYETFNNSVTFIQYQAGAMGLNLQKANKIVYFTPPLSSELFEQSKKRIHRIGQNSTCFYYMLTCKNSIEEKIYRTLEMRKDYTDKLFEMEE